MAEAITSGSYFPFSRFLISGRSQITGIILSEQRQAVWGPPCPSKTAKNDHSENIFSKETSKQVLSLNYEYHYFHPIINFNMLRLFAGKF